MIEKNYYPLFTHVCVFDDLLREYSYLYDKR